MEPLVRLSQPMQTTQALYLPEMKLLLALDAYGRLTGLKQLSSGQTYLTGSLGMKVAQVVSILTKCGQINPMRFKH